MYTLRLLICLTTTVMFASSMYFFDSSVRRSRNWSGVKPAATTSLINDIEIRPSGLTCTSVVMSLSFQYTIDNTSSVPITYPGGGGTAATAAAGAAGRRVAA